MLDRLVEAWRSFDGDMLVSIFTEDAEYHVDPFGPPLVGHNAIRAQLLAAAESQDQLELTLERHWTSGSTVLAAWHSSFVRQSDAARVRAAAFITLEIRDGRCWRFREWMLLRDGTGVGG
jgi:hypothetical protein